MSFAGAHIGTSTGDKSMHHIQHDPYDVAFLLGPGSGRAELYVGVRDVCTSDIPTLAPPGVNGNHEQVSPIIETINTISLTMTQDPQDPGLTKFEFRTRLNPGQPENDQRIDTSIAIRRAHHVLMTLRHYVGSGSMHWENGPQSRYPSRNRIRHNYLPPETTYQTSEIEQLRLCVFSPSTAVDFTRFVGRTGINFKDINEIRRTVEVAAEVQEAESGQLGPEGITGLFRNTWPFLEGTRPLAIREGYPLSGLNGHHRAGERR